jgi:co-chaperonin GroES (HSP10)
MPHNYIRLSKEEFDRAKPLNNYVVIESILPKDYEVRKSGLIVVKDPKLFIHQSIRSAQESKVDMSAPLDRIGKVAKVCDSLHVKKRISQTDPQYKEKMKEQDWKMEWETTIEIQVGDIVAFNYFDGLHCIVFQVEDKEYRLLEYWNLIVAKRTQSGKFKWLKDKLTSSVEFTPIEATKEEYDGVKQSFARFDECGVVADYDSWELEIIIPLNGYCLFTRLKEEINTTVILPFEHTDKKRGIVKYCGSKVEYWDIRYFDDIEIKPGDEVLFKNEVERLLEDSAHYHMFDEELRWEQRSNIYGVKENV